MAERTDTPHKIAEVLRAFIGKNNKKYFALLPLKGEKELDFSQSYMLYEVEEDEEQNPIVLYIENDLEYEIAASYFSRMLKKK